MQILVVDDEKLARDRLLRMLEKLPDCDIAGEAGDGRSAIDAAQNLKPDVVLLDIRMPDMDGLEAARHLNQLENPPAVIFCTAYGEHALEAFDAQAIGYLLKPVKAEQLEKALQQAQKLSHNQMQNLANADQDQLQARKHISSKTRLGLELVPIENVRCFQADHKYVTAFHTGGELLLDETLKELEQEFGQRFVRIHRNCLVAIDYVEGMERIDQSQYVVNLADIELKPLVSRRHVTDLRKKLRSL